MRPRGRRGRRCAWTRRWQRRHRSRSRNRRRNRRRWRRRRVARRSSESLDGAAYHESRPRSRSRWRRRRRRGGGVRRWFDGGDVGDGAQGAGSGNGTSESEPNCRRQWRSSAPGPSLLAAGSGSLEYPLRRVHWDGQCLRRRRYNLLPFLGGPGRVGRLRDLELPRLEPHRSSSPSRLTRAHPEHSDP